MIRNSKATKENFFTGEVLEVIKEKPIKNMRGVHTVELFDADSGKIVERIKSENFITPLMDLIQQRWALFAFDAVEHYWSGGDWTLKSVSQSHNFLGKSALNINSPLTYIHLTTCEEPERPDREIAERGRLIGWAQRFNSYSGSDTQRGTYNSAESFVTKGQRRLVFDFPTHAANGTFHSISWGTESTYNQALDYPEFGALEKKINLPAGYSEFTNKVIFKNNKLHIMARTSEDQTIYHILSFNLSADLQNITFDRVHMRMQNVSGAIKANETYNWDMDNLGRVWLGNYNGSISVYGTDGAPINVPGTTDKTHELKRWDTGSSNGYGTNRGFAIVGDILHIDWRTMSRGDKERLKIAKVRTDNVKTVLSVTESEAEGSSSSSDSTYYLRYVPGAEQLAINASHNSNMEFFDTETYTPNSMSPLRVWGFGGNFQPIIYRNDRFYGISLTSSNGIVFRVRPMGSMGARNLLPSPVTKTNTNTMKVTYDLFINTEADPMAADDQGTT